MKPTNEAYSGLFCAGLNVECVGKSQVHWSETEAVGRETETVHYQASENYFYHKVLLFGGIQYITNYASIGLLSSP